MTRLVPLWIVKNSVDKKQVIIVLSTQIYINQIFHIRLVSSQHTQRQSREGGREVGRGRLYAGRDGYTEMGLGCGGVEEDDNGRVVGIDTYVA